MSVEDDQPIGLLGVRFQQGLLEVAKSSVLGLSCV